MANKPTRIIYALYHGDDFIDSGTAKELSRKYHRSRSWIYSLAADRNEDDSKGIGVIAWQDLKKKA